jgi:hypothetical protein
MKQQNSEADRDSDTPSNDKWLKEVIQCPESCDITAEGRLHGGGKAD